MTTTTKVLLTISVIAAVWWGLSALIDTHNHNVSASFNQKRAEQSQFEKEIREIIKHENHKRNSR